MTNWAEEQIEALEADIERLEELKEGKSTLEKERYNSMIADMKSQLLPLYRHAIREGSPLCQERLAKYERPHKESKVFFSDPHKPEVNLSDLSVQLYRTYSAEDSYFQSIEEDEVLEEEVILEGKIPSNLTIDLGFLSDQQLKAIQMISDGVTYNEVARTLGLKKGSISKHILLARKKALDPRYQSVQLAFKFADDEPNWIRTEKKTNDIKPSSKKKDCHDDSEQLSFLFKDNT